MINRINKNEERFDKVLKSVKDLEVSLTNFESSIKDLELLKKYYDSKNWIKDKDTYEKESLKIKAGVLSEDGVWNMLSDIDSLIDDMKRIIKKYDNTK